MRIALLGYGKMGKTIEQIAVAEGHSISFKNTSIDSEGSLENADVAIDFSTPESAVDNISLAINNNIPIVSGTTGWLAHYQEILNLCEERNGAFIYASNFSIGVNLFFKLNEYAAKLMEPWTNYNPTIHEIHHTEKKDAPSGTAISLADRILKNSAKSKWKLDGSSEHDLNITATRENDVKGVHKIIFESDIDSISLIHEAKSRDGFAIGALLAAKWIQDKKGVYTMKDVLGLT